MIEVKSFEQQSPQEATQAAMTIRGLEKVAIGVLLATGLSACSGLGGTTYGTGQSQEAALLKDVTGGFGLIPSDEKPEPIDYSARAGLVLPPDANRLPNPQDRNAATANTTNWPQDPDQLRKLYAQRMESMTEEERKQLLAAIRRLPPEQRDAIIKNDTRRADFARDIKEPDPETASAAEMAEYERQVQQRRSLIRLQNGENAKGRKYLTQPPERLTEVSPEVQQEIAKVDLDKEKKENKGFFKKLWPF